MSQPIVIAAAIAGNERPALIAAAEQLCEALQAASGEPWTAQLRLRDSAAAAAEVEGRHVIIASLMPELAAPEEDRAAMHARWTTTAGTLLAAGVPATFLMTVFRKAPPGVTHRIRALNLMAVRLSSETGVNLIDVDRTLAHVGAQAAGCDYSLAGRTAAEMAGHAIAAAILEAGLDDIVPPGVGDAAKARHGGLRGIDAVMARRLARAG